MKNLTKADKQGKVIWDSLTFDLVERQLPPKTREKHERLGYPRCTFDFLEFPEQYYSYITWGEKIYIAADKPKE